MGLIQTVRPWARQPSSAVQIDWAHWISEGAKFASIGSAQGRDLVAGKAATKYGSTAHKPTRIGVGVDVSAGNAAYEWPASSAWGGALSIFCCVQYVGTPSNDGGIFVVTHSSNSINMPYVASSIKVGNTTDKINGAFNYGGTYGAISITAGTPSVGDVDLVMMTVKSGSQVLYLSRNGGAIQTASAANSGSIAWGSGPRVVVGEDYRFASRNSMVSVANAIVWNRFVESTRVPEVFRSHWRIYAPSRIYWPKAAAGGLPTLTALSISSITTSGATLTITAS